MKTRIIFTALLLLSSWCAFAQDAEYFYRGTPENPLGPRTALVIGIPAVRGGAGFLNLKNPINDANKVAAALRRLDFIVIAPHEDYPADQLTRQTIKRAVYDFAFTLKNVGGVGVVYYSGHGVQRSKDHSYLVPFDAFVRYGRDVDEELVPVSLFYDAFEYANNVLNLLIIDACRDFPFKETSDFGSRSARAEPDTPAVFRANATLSGARAADGSAELSPYANAFVSALELKDAGLDEVFREVSNKLGQLERQQVAVVTKSGSRDFVFRPTLTTFYKEREIFAGGGPRYIYEQLGEKFAGGYFGAAALKLLATTPVPAQDAGQPVVGRFQVSFEPRRVEDGSERLTDGSRSVVQGIAQGILPSRLDRAEIIAYRDSLDPLRPNPDQRLLQRQAAVAEALKGVKVAEEKMVPSVKASTASYPDGTVEVVFRARP